MDTVILGVVLVVVTFMGYAAYKGLRKGADDSHVYTYNKEEEPKLTDPFPSSTEFIKTRPSTSRDYGTSTSTSSPPSTGFGTKVSRRDDDTDTSMGTAAGVASGVALGSLVHTHDTNYHTMTSGTPESIEHKHVEPTVYDYTPPSPAPEVRTTDNSGSYKTSERYSSPSYESSHSYSSPSYSSDSGSSSSSDSGSSFSSSGC